MRGNRIHTRAKRRIRNDHRQAAVNEFDHRILADGVHDDIVEDQQLAETEDAIAKLEDQRDRRRDELAETTTDHAAEIVRSIEHLQGTARQRVMELCAIRCDTVLADGDEWVDEGWEDADAVQAAKHEAAQWLIEHADVRTRLWGEEGPDALNEFVAEVEA